VNRSVVFYFTAFFRPSSLTNETLLPHRGCGRRGDGPAFFREPTGRCRQHSPGGKANLHSLLLVLVLVIVIEGKDRIDHEQEHERDYDGGEVRKMSGG